MMLAYRPKQILCKTHSKCRLALLLLLCLQIELVAAEIYTWKDENGTVHFSQNKPKNHNTDSESVDIKLDYPAAKKEPEPSYFDLPFQEQVSQPSAEHAAPQLSPEDQAEKLSMCRKAIDNANNYMKVIQSSSGLIGSFIEKIMPSENGNSMETLLSNAQIALNMDTCLNSQGTAKTLYSCFAKGGTSMVGCFTSNMQLPDISKAGTQAQDILSTDNSRTSTAINQ